MPTVTEAAACPNCGLALGVGSACPRCSYVLQTPARPSTFSFPVRANLALLLFAGFIVIATVVYLNEVLVQSTAYQNSLKTAFSSTEVQSMLGSRIRAKQPVLGYLFPFTDSQFAQWSVTLTGSRGSGHLYGVANQTNGTWDFSRLVFQPANSKDKIDLTPVRRPQLPSVPTKNVYLIPVGLVDGE